MSAFRDPVDWERTLPVRPGSLAWRATIRALYGTPLDAEELTVFRSLAGREPPAGGADEFQAVVGRRGGKSETIARLAVFEAVHGGHQIALAPGQVGLIPVISPLREQSGEIVRYCHGLASLPQVKPFVDGEPTRDGVRFTTGIEIRCVTADAVSVSGPTVVFGIRDEWAKAPGNDAVVSDRMIDDSLRPALAPVVGAPRRRLIGITSAYIREGVAFETDRDHYGRDDADVLVVRGRTEQFNPSIDTDWLARERRRVGERVFAREYEGIWQDAAIESWFGGDVIDGSVDKGRKTLKPSQQFRYFAGLDLGVRVDGTALAVAHREITDEGQTVTVVDHVQYWRPRSATMDQIVREAAKCIREYGATAYADQFHFDSAKDNFAREGVHLREAPWTSTGGQSKTIRFNSVRNEMINGALRLPDDPDLIREFHSLAGRLRRGSDTEQLSARSGSDDRVHAVTLVASQILDEQPERTRWPGDWTFAEYLERLPGLAYHGPIYRSVGGKWSDLLFNQNINLTTGHSSWTPVSYPELRRRVAAWKKERATSRTNPKE